MGSIGARSRRLVVTIGAAMSVLLASGPLVVGPASAQGLPAAASAARAGVGGAMSSTGIHSAHAPSRVKPWELAPSLVALRAEVDARWPERSRVSDGAIGDRRHRKTKNSHNPVGRKGGPEHGTKGSVHALDITAEGIDADLVVDALIGDPRVWYVIFDGRIWSRTQGWAPRHQVGDPHRTHIHVSLRDSSQEIARRAEDDTARWLPSRSPADTSRGGALTTPATRSLQKALITRGYRIPSGPTGWYGPETTKAVSAFQRDQGWSGSGADGKAGSTTLRRLGVESSGGAAAAEKKAAAKAKQAAKAKAAKKKAAKKKAAAKKAAAKKKAKKTAKKVTSKKRPSGAKKKAPKKKSTKHAGKVKSGQKGAKKGTSAKKTGTKKAGTKKAGTKKAKPAAGTSKGASAAKIADVYQPGTASREVYFLQEELIDRGYDIPAGPTGYYGPRTVAAVKAFQRAQGWPDADGIPGRPTLTRLGLL